MALAYATTLRTTRVDAITAAIGASGLLRIYDGVRPASGGAATTKLAELALSATAAPGAVAGVLTLSAISNDASADASGTATWFRITTSGGTFIIDGNVGTAGSDLNLTTTTIVIGSPVAVTSFVITEGNA